MSELQFVDIDATTISEELIQSFEEETGETLYPGDERRIFLLNFLPVLVALKNDINNSAKQTLLRYAYGDNLTALCKDWYGVDRLPAQAANVTLRFTLSAVQATDITIPQGTRATPDGILFFQTREDLAIAAGNTYGDVIAEAILSDEDGAPEPEDFNGFTAGQIKILVDPVAFVESVVNTDNSASGANIESDEDLRSRAQIAPESYSVAGPAGAYEYWARTADSTISDVKASSPSAGVVRVVVLQEDGQIPGAELLQKVTDILSADDIRPLTDNVEVVAATPVEYDVDFTYYISTADQTQVSSIRSRIEDSGGIVDQYVAWQAEKLNRDINPDELRKLVLTAGAYRMTVTSPVFAEVDEDEVASIGTINITYGGLVAP